MKTTIKILLRMLTLVSLAAVVSCSTRTPAKPNLEGRWSGFEAGRSEMITVEFTGNHFAYWDATNKELGGGTFVVNSSVQPMQMDLTFERIVSPDYVGKIGLSIFELRGDELTFAGAEPGATLRPTSFDGGDGVRVFHFKRQ